MSQTANNADGGHRLATSAIIGLAAATVVAVLVTGPSTYTGDTR